MSEKIISDSLKNPEVSIEEKIWKEAQISLAKELIALPVDVALSVLEKLASSK